MHGVRSVGFFTACLRSERLVFPVKVTSHRTLGMSQDSALLVGNLPTLT